MNYKDIHIGSRIQTVIKEPIHIDADCMGYNFVNPASILEFAEDVRKTKEQCDICIAYFHKGYVHKQVLVDDWERLISHIAIDSGADVVMASHSHIAHGVEFYKGKAIYHGLNNFVMYTPQLAPGFKGTTPCAGSATTPRKPPSAAWWQTSSSWSA